MQASIIHQKVFSMASMWQCTMKYIPPADTTQTCFYRAEQTTVKSIVSDDAIFGRWQAPARRVR